MPIMPLLLLMAAVLMSGAAAVVWYGGLLLSECGPRGGMSQSGLNGRSFDRARPATRWSSRLVHADSVRAPVPAAAPHSRLPASGLTALSLLAAVTTAATVPEVKALECLSACEFSAPPLQGFDLYSRFFLAGGICASLSHGVAIPFDVVKTRLQTASTAEFASSNVVSVAQTIIAREGPGMLFKGTGPTLVGYLIQGSLKYGFYEVFKPLVAAALVTSELTDSASTGAEKLVSFMLAGAAAELIGSSFLAPFEAARIRLVANPSFAPGIVTCLTRIVDEETPEALFRGLPAILSKQVPYTVVQLSSYETLTTAVYSALDAAGLGSEAAGAWRYVISAGCAVVAAVLSSLASQPGDTLLSAVNKSAKTAAAALGADGAAGRPQGPLAVMGATINELGVAGLFKGTKARLVHVTVIVVTQLLVYDFIKSLCGLPATGQH